MQVLEPSAGTGRLLEAILSHAARASDVTAVEIDHGLCQQLNRFSLRYLARGNFLDWAAETLETDLRFDRVVMNPPFTMGEDVHHILAARALLVPGGRLVAFCADGPRQREALQATSGSWESLPAGSFRGTGVRAALLSMTNPVAVLRGST